jgi:hypothetical protein
VCVLNRDSISPNSFIPREKSYSFPLKSFFHPQKRLLVPRKDYCNPRKVFLGTIQYKVRIYPIFNLTIKSFVLPYLLYQRSIFFKNDIRFFGIRYSTLKNIYKFSLPTVNIFVCLTKIFKNRMPRKVLDLKRDRCSTFYSIGNVQKRGIGNLGEQLSAKNKSFVRQTQKLSVKKWSV